MAMQTPRLKHFRALFTGEFTENQSGFTVAEILIAIFIFAVIVTTVFGSYRATSEQVEIVSRNRKLVEMGRICLDRMTNDLKALHASLPPEYSKPEINSDPDPYRVVGTNETIGSETYASLRFTSFAHLPIRPSRSFGIAQIVYYVQRDDNDQYHLHRADQLFPYDAFEADPADPVLCGPIRSFSLTYYDNTGRSYDTWDSESESNEFSTPSAVGIRLEIGDEKDTQIFSTRVLLNVYRTAPDAE